MVMAYDWSMKGISHIISTCGKIICHKKNYATKYADDHGEVYKKELPRPAMTHTPFDFRPSIDEHTKQR